MLANIYAVLWEFKTDSKDPRWQRNSLSTKIDCHQNKFKIDPFLGSFRTVGQYMYSAGDHILAIIFLHTDYVVSISIIFWVKGLKLGILLYNAGTYLPFFPLFLSSSFPPPEGRREIYTSKVQYFPIYFP